MPRQRKPQNGGARLGTWRVANTTTSSQPKLQTVYRIPRGWSCGTDCWMEIEILWQAPVKIHREGETIWNISLDSESLKSVIENYDNLDLSHVTLQSVDGNVTFTGKVTAEGGFEWDITAVNLTATNGTIETLNSTTATVNDLTSTTSSLWTASASSVDTALLAVGWASTLSWNVVAESDLSVGWTLTAATWDITNLTAWTLSVTNWATVGNGLTADATTTTTLNVNWASTFTGDMTAGNITSSGTASLDTVIVSWASTLNTLTVNGATMLNSNAAIAGNLSITGNETITGNQTVTGDGIFSNDVSVARNLNVSGDTTITDDLTVNWSTHLKDLETTGSVDVGWTLRTTWAAVIGNWLNVTGQMESDTVRTDEVIANEVRVTDGLYLSQWGEAPDFVLQSEKGQPNGVAPLNANAIVPEEHLPPIYTSAIVKVGVGTFSNSNTSTVLDEDITSDSFVAISNYLDIVWDLDETIAPWQLTVVSNQTETWSYKYIVVNPLTSCNS